MTLLAVGVIAGAGWVGYSAYAANGEGERCTRLERSIESVIYNSGGADITLLSESNLLDWLVENRTKYEDAVDELYSRQLPSDSVERQTALLEREITMDRIDERLIEWGRNETPRLLAATGCA